MKANENGFSLIEMALAVAITAALVGAVYAAFVSSARTAEAQAVDSAVDLSVARTVDLLRADLHSRYKMRMGDPESEGTTTLILSTTSDSLSVGVPRRALDKVLYVASPQGLTREEESGGRIELARGKVFFEFWQRGAWRKELGASPSAVRITFGAPPQIVVIR